MNTYADTFVCVNLLHDVNDIAQPCWKSEPIKCSNHTVGTDGIRRMSQSNNRNTNDPESVDHASSSNILAMYKIESQAVLFTWRRWRKRHPPQLMWLAFAWPALPLPARHSMYAALGRSKVKPEGGQRIYAHMISSPPSLSCGCQGLIVRFCDISWVQSLRHATGWSNNAFGPRRWGQELVLQGRPPRRPLGVQRWPPSTCDAHAETDRRKHARRFFLRARPYESQ